VTALDDYTVEFTLEHETAYFPTVAGLWIYRPLHRSTLEEYGTRWTEPRYIQTNGSYLLSEWKKGKFMVLKKNPDYYDAAKVAIPEIRFHVIPESCAGMVMYRNHDIDILGGNYLHLPLTEVPNIKTDPDLSKEYFSQSGFCNYAYGFNVRRPPMDNLLVRKAISAAIDRRLITEVITEGNEIPAATFSWPGMFGAEKNYEDTGIAFNPAQAKKWLAEAGYPDGKDFPEITLVFNRSENHSRIAQAVRTLLKYYLNITIRLEEQYWEDYVENIKQPNTPHMFRFGFCPDYPEASSYLKENFHPLKSANHTGWDNPEFTDLMDEAEGTPDPEKRKELYRKAEQILCADACAVLPICFESTRYLVHPRIKGWYHMKIGGQHIRNWYFAEQTGKKTSASAASGAGPPKTDRKADKKESSVPKGTANMHKSDMEREKAMFGNIFEQTYYGNMVWQWALALILIFLALVIGKAVYWFFSTILKKLAAKTETKLDDILIDMTEEPLVMVGILMAVWYSMKVLTLNETAYLWLGKIYYILIIFNIAWLISRTVDALVENYVVPLTKKTETDLDDLLLPVARNAFRFIVWAMALIVGMNNAGYDVGAIIAGLGIGGLAVAMAAKDTLANMLGGFTIMASRPFKVGDRIKVSGFDAVVREIGMRTSRLEEFSSKRIITMPNAAFSDKPIVNVSSEPLRWISLNIRLSNRNSGEKMELVCKLLEDIVKAHSNAKMGFVFFGSFDNFSLGVELKYGIISISGLATTQTEINVEILKQFEKNHIELAQMPSMPAMSSGSPS